MGMRSKIRKMKSRGFGLVELLLVIMILGILAGMTLLAFARGTDSADAAAIMSNLDSAKNAMLAYSMEHRTRNVDPLGNFTGLLDGEIIPNIDKYLDPGYRNSSAAVYFDKLRVRTAPSGSGFEVGFAGISISSGIANALNKKIAAGGAYNSSGAPANYSIWLSIR